MIFKYEVINPIVNRKKPHVDKHGVFIIPNIKRNYKYCIETRVYNTSDLCYNYYLLLGVDKFDNNCNKCRVDDYGRLKVVTHRDFKDFIDGECKSRGNVNVTYMESECNYDVYKID